MRVSVVTESFHPAGRAWRTAADRATSALVDRLADTGHAVSVVAPGPGLASYRHLPVHRVELRDRPGRQVRAALDSAAPDVVLVLDPGALGRKALAHTEKSGVASVVTQREPVPGPGRDRWRTRVADRAGDLLVTSRWLQRSLAEDGIHAGLWLPGVDADAFSPVLRDDWLHHRWSRARALSGPRVVVGYVGDLRRPQGVRRLAALAGVPGIRPVIIGSGPQRGWLRSRLPHAVFLAPPSTAELAVAMASFDLLVHPGEEQTCAPELRAGAASGLPLVAPAAGGALDVVRSLENGLLYDPGDPRGLARAVAAVAADPRRSLLGTRGRELALTRSWPHAVDELVGSQAGRAVA